MNTVFFGNNWLGLKLFKWLVQEEQKPEGLVLNPPSKRSYGKEFRKVASMYSVEVFELRNLDSDQTIEKIESLNPDLGVCVLYGKIFPPEFLDIFSKGIINLHPSYLPYNRGAYPNVWSIVEETPAGVSLHFINEKIDTGDIIAQERVNKEPVDTGKTLYRKLEMAGLSLFKEEWPKIAQGEIQGFNQDLPAGTYHTQSDVQSIDEIDLDEKYQARRLINILRARTFKPHDSAFFEVNGEKIFVRVELEYAEETDIS